MRLICGGSGLGKTTAVFNELISESVRHEDTRYFLVVPEQASSFYEKELIKRHPRHGALNIEILSFNRLAYRIELANVLGWQCVVNKNQFRSMELAVYFEIDSFLPIRPEFEFMRASSYRKTDVMGEGFRLRTMNFRGQISQGLLLFP